MTWVRDEERLAPGPVLIIGGQVAFGGRAVCVCVPRCQSAAPDFLSKRCIRYSCVHTPRGAADGDPARWDVQVSAAGVSVHTMRDVQRHHC